MKLPFDLKKGASIITKLKSNYSMLLWLVLVLIATMTGWIIFQEIHKVVEVQPDTEGIMDKIIRVNVAKHQNIEKVLGENSSFQPYSVPGTEAFSTPPVVRQE